MEKRPFKKQSSSTEPHGKLTHAGQDMQGANPLFSFDNQRQDYGQQKDLVKQLKADAGDGLPVPNPEILGEAPIQRKRNRKAGWNEKQKAQNARLLDRWERRAAAREAAEERERVENAAQAQGLIDIKANMKVAQGASFDAQTDPVKAVMVRLFRKGFLQQDSAGRAVFNKNGSFAECKQHAGQLLGALGPNLENGVDAKPDGEIKERYTIAYQGVNVIVRNFSSSAVIRGTIEFQTGVVFEFKYA